MGSTIYSQKLKHPVYVSFTCEHCGQYNSFAQEIVGAGNAEVNNIRSDKYRQEQISKVGPKAETTYSAIFCMPNKRWQKATTPG